MLTRASRQLYSEKFLIYFKFIPPTSHKAFVGDNESCGRNSPQKTDQVQRPLTTQGLIPLWNASFWICFSFIFWGFFLFTGYFLRCLFENSPRFSAGSSTRQRFGDSHPAMVLLHALRRGSGLAPKLPSSLLQASSHSMPYLPVDMVFRFFPRWTRDKAFCFCQLQFWVCHIAYHLFSRCASSIGTTWSPFWVVSSSVGPDAGAGASYLGTRKRDREGSCSFISLLHPPFRPSFPFFPFHCHPSHSSAFRTKNVRIPEKKNTETTRPWHFDGLLAHTICRRQLRALCRDPALPVGLHLSHCNAKTCYWFQLSLVRPPLSFWDLWVAVAFDDFWPLVA